MASLWQKKIQSRKDTKARPDESVRTGTNLPAGRQGRNTKMLTPEIEHIGKVIVNSAFRIHKELRSGLLEKVYEICLAHEISKEGIEVLRQLDIPIV